MIIESELRDEMMRAVRGASSLNDLYDWLMSRSWNMHRDSAPAAVELAAEVEALLIERADGVLDSADVMRRIDGLLDRIVVSAPVDVAEQLVVAQPRFINSVPVFRPPFRLALA